MTFDINTFGYLVIILYQISIDQKALVTPYKGRAQCVRKLLQRILSGSVAPRPWHIWLLYVIWTQPEECP